MRRYLGLSGRQVVPENKQACIGDFSKELPDEEGFFL
jgi:hypothetical protein